MNLHKESPQSHVEVIKQPLPETISGEFLLIFENVRRQYCSVFETNSFDAVCVSSKYPVGILAVKAEETAVSYYIMSYPLWKYTGYKCKPFDSGI